MARCDLLRAACHTASCTTKWTEQRDVDLFRLICYIKCTSHFRMSSWIGDTMEDGGCLVEAILRRGPGQKHQNT
eukprot:1393984-Pyramimonas_sp.AAC.1